MERVRTIRESDKERERETEIDRQTNETYGIQQMCLPKKSLEANLRCVHVKNTQLLVGTIVVMESG